MLLWHVRSTSRVVCDVARNRVVVSPAHLETTRIPKKKKYQCQWLEEHLSVIKTIYSRLRHLENFGTLGRPGTLLSWCSGTLRWMGALLNWGSSTLGRPGTLLSGSGSTLGWPGALLSRGSSTLGRLGTLLSRGSSTLGWLGALFCWGSGTLGGSRALLKRRRKGTLGRPRPLLKCGSESTLGWPRPLLKDGSESTLGRLGALLKCWREGTLGRLGPRFKVTLRGPTTFIVIDGRRGGTFRGLFALRHCSQEPATSAVKLTLKKEERKKEKNI